ncbi:hypothetical protein CRG98_018995 [Punica granatum]|uniref:SMP domain-containing protein n=1 Tax=Punica granatum TaxID=22663 RepID=A0A2I0JW31_PUNGR|nr:hypothetical protein CRG98_018995 [Punica granatum]
MSEVSCSATGINSRGCQVLGQYVEPAPVKLTSPTGALDQDATTIGEALEAAALSTGDKPVDQSDAATIEVAEARAIGTGEIVPGGNNVLKGVKDKLPVTVQDAEAVIGAELRNNPSMATTPGGVAESIAEAARLNQSK